MFNRVLVLAPHTDDGELGAGATIAKLAESGAEVSYIAFSIAEDSVPEGYPSDILAAEVSRATSVLGIEKENMHIHKFPVRKLCNFRQEILEILVSFRSELQPDLVLLPSSSDIHQDHGVIAMEGLRAFKRTTIWGYELVWNNLLFQHQLAVKVTEEQVAKKCKALAEFNSQAGRDYMSEGFIRSLAKVRGVQVGAEYAESFEVVRAIVE